MPDTLRNRGRQAGNVDGSGGRTRKPGNVHPEMEREEEERRSRKERGTDIKRERERENVGAANTDEDKQRGWEHVAALLFVPENVGKWSA